MQKALCGVKTHIGLLFYLYKIYENYKKIKKLQIIVD